MGAVMRDHVPAGVRPGQPLLEPSPMVLVNPDGLVRSDPPVARSGVPNVVVFVHLCAGDLLGRRGAPVQLEVGP